MKFKTLLCAVAMLATTLAAYAFPSYTLNPASGSSYDNVENLTSFNISVNGSYAVTSGAKATLFNEETGDEAFSTTFKDFMGMAIVINFDASEIISNGEWTLTIPAGSFTSGSEDSPEITATYKLDDPALGGGQTFPEIKLVSTDPADGAKLRALGGSQFPEITTPGSTTEKMHVMKIVTDNDAAVNHIAWYFYDVTNEDAPEYIASGNDNRYDQNRFPGYQGDTWADGLWCAMEHDTDQLIEGHKYKMELNFYGIGYDLEKNQYPSPSQLAQSLELSTAIYFEGQTPATEYSPYVVESVSPNPEEYEIDKIEFGRFTMTYSGPVKPTQFIYAQMTGVTPPAGTYTAIEPDENGYAKVWEFVFDQSVLENSLGYINVTVQAQDANGLYVKGNAEYNQNNFSYTMQWSCNLGADEIISVEPLDGATVESLASISVSNDANKVMAMSWVTAEKPYITTMGRDAVRTLGDPTFSSDLKTATWTFDPITEDGVYILVIPKQYFAIGEEFDGTTSNATEFRYIVEGPKVSTVTADLIPSSVVPADGSEVTELTTVTITFPEVTFIGSDEETWTYKAANLYKVTETGDVFIESVPAADNAESDWFDPTIYDYTFTKITAEGTYKLVIPEGQYFNSEWDMSMGESGRINPELSYTWTIKPADTPEIPDVPGVAYDIALVSSDPANGATVDKIQTINVTFNQATWPVWNKSTYNYTSSNLYKVTDNGDEFLESIVPNESRETDPSAPTTWSFRAFNTVATDGNYKLVIAKGTFVDAADGRGSYNHACDEIVINIIVDTTTGINSIFASEDGTYTVYTIAGVCILDKADKDALKNLNKGLYIINGKKVVIK